MPKGPRGEKRPADVIGAALKVMRIGRLRTRPRLSKARSTPERAVCAGARLVHKLSPLGPSAEIRNSSNCRRSALEEVL